jgi:hypothetical protein
MLFVPKEIFSLIEPDNVSLFLTCKFFYEFVDIFYRHFKFDFSRNPIVLTSDGSSNQKGVTNASNAVIPNYYNNIYILINVPDGIFQNIRHISFDKPFDKNMDALHYLPKLESITFDHNFTHPVNNLPPRGLWPGKTLTSITFGQSFNQRVDNLPKTLKSLTFGLCFNQRVDNLPERLTSLTFGHMFYQPADNLPKTLTSLIFGYWFDQPVDDLPCGFFNLPKTLTSLTFGCYFNQRVDNLPETLKSITFGHMFNQPVYNLPETLTSLTFDDSFNQPVENLPETLTSLTFRDSFNYKLNLRNFPVLKLLKLSKKYDQIIDLEDCPLTLKNIAHE